MHYLLRVGSATSHLQTDSSWCGDERDKACYLIGLEGQQPTCTYGTDLSWQINKLKSLELFEAGLRAWPKKNDRRLSGHNAHLVSWDIFSTWPSSERRLVRPSLLNHASANPRLPSIQVYLSCSRLEPGARELEHCYGRACFREKPNAICVAETP